MKKFTTWAFVSAIALTLAGCGGGEEVAEEPAAPAPQAQAPAPAPAPAAQPFNQPTVPQSAPGSSALIQSTNVSERVRQVSSGRQDPFAVVQVAPVIERPQTAAGAAGQVPSRPANASGGGTAGAGATAGRPSGAAAGGTAARPGAGSTRPGASARPGGAGGAASGASGARPGTPAKPQPPAIAALPPLPQPTLAQAVEITGVLEAAGSSQAIVRTPDAPSGRYVSVGQRLMDGQVLVKRIEMRGSEPVVVLEQDGVEVAKRVGESATPSTQQAAAAGRIAG